MSVQNLDPNTTALVLIDFINDIVSENGKLSGKGYKTFIQEQKIDEKVVQLLAKARSHDWSIIHVRIGFSPTYTEHPTTSPLFGGIKKLDALIFGSWGTEFAEFARPLSNETIVEKHRVSAFYGTDLETLLHNLGTQNVILAGCATDLAVQAAARDAHDRDFRVVIVDDACAAATIFDHTSSLVVLSKIATITTVAKL